MSITNWIKALYEQLPKSVKFMFSSIFIRAMIQNKEFVKIWNELDKFEKLSEKEKKQIQFQRLKECLQYAYDNVPYYRELFDKCGFDPKIITKTEDIEVLPLLEKSDAVILGDKLYSQDSKLNFYKTFTGGSSGQALTVLLDKNSIYRERACVVHYLSKFGYDPLKTRTVAFWGHNKNSDYYYSPLKNEIVISPFRLFKEDQIESICDDIEKFGATFIMGYPSAIYTFSQMLEKSGRKIKIDHVVYYAENCSPEEKAFIGSILECPVDSYYGHTERSCFAEIYDEGCVFNDYYGYTELLPTDNNNEYRIVCTGFLSKKMPLIRYATDDVVYKDEDGSMHIVGHKRSEIYLISKNGKRIFKGAMTLHIEELKKILRYQYVQNVPGEAELHLVENETLTKEELGHIDSYIKRRCEGLLEVEIIVVEEIQLTNRGKYNWAVNNIK